MRAPEHVDMGEPEEKIIIGHIDGVAHFMTRSEAISLINELSGVLLAYEYRTGHRQRDPGNQEDIRNKSG